jgi:hypothetical protein
MTAHTEKAMPPAQARAVRPTGGMIITAAIDPPSAAGQRPQR